MLLQSIPPSYTHPWSFSPSLSTGSIIWSLCSWTPKDFIKLGLGVASSYPRLLPNEKRHYEYEKGFKGFNTNLTIMISDSDSGSVYLAACKKVCMWVYAALCRNESFSGFVFVGVFVLYTGFQVFSGVKQAVCLQQCCSQQRTTDRHICITGKLQNHVLEKFLP